MREFQRRALFKLKSQISGLLCKQASACGNCQVEASSSGTSKLLPAHRSPMHTCEIPCTCSCGIGRATRKKVASPPSVRALREWSYGDSPHSLPHVCAHIFVSELPQPPVREHSSTCTPAVTCARPPGCPWGPRLWPARFAFRCFLVS